MNISAIGMMQYKNQAPLSQVNSSEDERLKKACSDFEAIFIRQMLESMRKTVQKTEMNGGGQAEELYEDMLYDKYAETMAKTARLGVAELMYRQLTAVKTEEV